MLENSNTVATKKAYLNKMIFLCHEIFHVFPPACHLPQQSQWAAKRHWLNLGYRPYFQNLKLRWSLSKGVKCDMYLVVWNTRVNFAIEASARRKAATSDSELQYCIYFTDKVPHTSEYVKWQRSELQGAKYIGRQIHTS